VPAEVSAHTKARTICDDPGSGICVFGLSAKEFSCDFDQMRLDDANVFLL